MEHIRKGEKDEQHQNVVMLWDYFRNLLLALPIRHLII